MATPKMSKEEAAVRKALAAVEADTGIATAQEIFKTGVVPAATTTPNVAYNPLTGRTISEYSSIGEYVDASVPKTQTGKTAEQIAAEAAAAAKAAADKAAADKLSTTTNLAEQEFINTIKLLIGSAEASKPYIKQLYTLTSKYYKTGSSIADAVNLALYDAQENKLIPEFTSRFSGIFKIQARRAAGEIIDVPTLSEYIKSQEVLADVFRQTSLGELANETFLNEVMGTGKSVAESTKIITDVYDAINTAPKEWYDMVQAKMPFATKPMLAKALLLGSEGAADLERKVNKYGIMAAAQGQGLTIGETTAGDLLAKGQGYTSSKPKFGQAA